jgi:hypothetical protein
MKILRHVATAARRRFRADYLSACKIPSKIFNLDAVDILGHLCLTFLQFSRNRRVAVFLLQNLACIFYGKD